jgi:hypothetical protein
VGFILTVVNSSCFLQKEEGGRDGKGRRRSRGALQRNNERRVSFIFHRRFLSEIGAFWSICRRNGEVEELRALNLSHFRASDLV